jgi:hypothetical protein
MCCACVRCYDRTLRNLVSTTSTACGTAQAPTQEEAEQQDVDNKDNEDEDDDAVPDDGDAGGERRRKAPSGGYKPSVRYRLQLSLTI